MQLPHCCICIDRSCGLLLGHLMRPSACAVTLCGTSAMMSTSIKQLQLLFVAVLLTAAVAVQSSTASDKPTATLTANSTIKGEWLQTFRKNRRIAAFVGISYAEAPVGNLRFHSPQEPKTWTGERQLDPVGSEPLCPQLDPIGQIIGQEDCLKLSVYTPENAKDFPILVWLHGGSFEQGSAREYGPQLLLDRDLILVVVNYRLGVLGFLSTEDEIAAGNWGLKDQVQALKWVRQHALTFGGNPNRITVGGTDAGAVSAHLHSMSQLSRRLLYAVISMSGTALSPNIPTPKGAARRRALRLAERLGCQSKNLTSVEAVKCLKDASVDSIIKSDTEGGWAPIVEDFVEEVDVAFLEEPPATILNNAMTHDLPWLTGFAIGDGRDRAQNLINNASAFAQLSTDFISHAGELLGYANTSPDPTEISNEVREFYFQDGNLTSKALEQMLLDAWYLAPVDEAVRLHAADCPASTFLYFFTHGEAATGADLVRLLFPPSAMTQSEAVTHVEKAASEVVLDLWANFVSKGEPSREGSQVEWKRAESNDLEFIEISEGGKLLRGKGLLGSRAFFWSSLPRTSRHATLLQASIPANLSHIDYHSEL